MRQTSLGERKPLTMRASLYWGFSLCYELNWEMYNRDHHIYTYSMLSSIAGLYPLDGSSTPSPSYDNQKTFHMAPGRESVSWGRYVKADILKNKDKLPRQRGWAPLWGREKGQTITWKYICNRCHLPNGHIFPSFTFIILNPESKNIPQLQQQQYKQQQQQ